MENVDVAFAPWTGRLVTVLLLASAVLTSCTTTGQQGSAYRAQLGQIRELGVKFDGRVPFSVLSSADKPGIAGIVLLGAVGGVIESGIRAGIDQVEADKLVRLLAGSDYPGQLRDALVQTLRMSNRFEMVATAPTELVVTLERWGLRPSLRRYVEQDKVQVAFEFNIRIISDNGAQILWESRDIYLHGKEHTLVDYENESELLKSELDEAVKEAAIQVGNIVRLACR